MQRFLLVFIILLFALPILCAAQSRGLFRIKENNKWGYIDNTGKTVIAPRFDSADDFSEGLAPVALGDRWGYIDKTGMFVIAPQFFEANSFWKGAARVGIYFKDRKIVNGSVGYYRYIGKSGKFVKESKREKLKNKFSEGLASVNSDKDCGYIDTKGKPAFDSRFIYCGKFSEGLAAVYNDDKWGFIDKTGKYVIESQFGETSAFSNGISIVQMVEIPKSFIGQGAYTVINKNGEFLFPLRFGQIRQFRDGLAAVSLDGGWYINGFDAKWGYINRYGKIVWKSFK